MKRIYCLLICVLLLLSFAACGSSDSSTKTIPETTAATEARVLTVAIDPHEESVFDTETVQLTAQAEGKVVWSSSDPGVAAVDENGVVTGVSAGTATITAALAEDYKVTAATEITVNQHVTAVSLAEEALTLFVGSPKGDAALEVTVAPENALIQGVVFSSSDESVVTVDAEGNVHAVAPGTAVITVRSEDAACEVTASCEITVRQGVTAINLSQESVDFYWGDLLKLTAEILPEDAEDKSVLWASSDESIATVDQNGVVTAVGTGTVEISCTAQDGSETSGVCTVNVVIGVKKLTVEAEKNLLLIGGAEELGKVQLSTAVEPENATHKTVVWTSSDEEVAKVDEDGVVTGVAPGKAVITAATTDPRFADKVKASVNVVVGNAVQDLKLEDLPERMAKGSFKKPAVVLTPDDVYNSKVEWSSSDESVIKVDAFGTVRAVGTGTAEVTCRTTDGTDKSFSQQITVFQSVIALQAGSYETVLFDGESATLTVKVSPQDATDKSVTWSSGDSSIASVSQDGVVTGNRAGKTTITATANDGSEKKCNFNIVVEPSVPVSLESLGFGIYNANLLGITVKNQCARHTVVNFDFDIELISYDGSKLSTSGSYSLGSNVSIGAGATYTIKRTLSGVAWAQKVKMTITGVQFSDKTYYSIPWSQQETWTFTRR